MTNSEKCKAISALMGPNVEWQKDKETKERVIALSKSFGWYKIKSSQETIDSVIKRWKRNMPYKEIAKELEKSKSTVYHIIADHKREIRRK